MFVTSLERVEAVAYKNTSLNGDYRESRANEPHWSDKTHRDDSIILEVLEKIKRRSDAGMKKYGVPMTREDVDTLQWLRHAQEEAMDFTIYLQRIISDYEARR